MLHRGGRALLQTAFQAIFEALLEFAVLLLGQFLHLENGVEVDSVDGIVEFIKVWLVVVWLVVLAVEVLVFHPQLQVISRKPF